MTPRALALALVATAAAGGAVTFAALRHRGGAGCGTRSAPARPATPGATLAAALRARADGDLAGLLALCSEAGRRQVAADLAAYSTVLRDPATGPRAVSRVPARTQAERDDLGAAIAGDAQAAFRVLARVAPMAAPAADPEPAPAAGAPPERVALEYTAPDGGRRLVSLARDGDAWRVERFPL